MQSRRFIWAFAVSVLVFSVLSTSFNFVVDPLQFHHRAWVTPPVFFYGMQRHEVPGLARNYTQDIAVVGTSVTENFLPSHVMASWGRPAVKLSMSGSTGHEQFLAARLAIGAGAREILWGVDVDAFYGRTDRVRNDVVFPHYLYRPMPIAPEY